MQLRTNILHYPLPGVLLSGIADCSQKNVPFRYSSAVNPSSLFFFFLHTDGRGGDIKISVLCQQRQRTLKDNIQNAVVGKTGCCSGSARSDSLLET